MARPQSSPFRQAGKPQALSDTLPTSDVGRIVSHISRTEAADGEARIERKSRLCSRPRLVQRPTQSQRAGELKMHKSIVSICLDTPAQPRDCCLVVAEMQMRVARKLHPAEGVSIARGEAKSLVDMSCGLRRTA